MARGAHLNGRPPGAAIHPLLVLTWVCVLVVSAEVDISQGEFPDVNEAVMLPEKAHLVRRASSRDVSWDPSDPMPEVTELLQEHEVAGTDDPTAVENEKDKVAAAQAKADEEKKELGEQQREAEGIKLLKEQNDAKAVEEAEGQQMEQKEKFEAVAAEKAAAAQELQEKAERKDQQALEKVQKQKELGEKKQVQDGELRKAEGDEEANKYKLHEKKEKTKKRGDETEEKEQCQKRSFKESEEKGEVNIMKFEKEQEAEEEKRNQVKLQEAQNRMKADEEEIKKEEEEDKERAANEKAEQDAENERKKAEAKKEAEDEEAKFEQAADQTSPEFPTNATEAEQNAEKLARDEDEAKKKELEDVTMKEVKEKADEKAEADEEEQDAARHEQEKKDAEQREAQEEKEDEDRERIEEEEEEKYQAGMRQKAMTAENQMKATQKQDELAYKEKCKEEKGKAEVLEKDVKEADNKQLAALENRGQAELDKVKVQAQQRLTNWTVANNTKAAKQRVGEAPVDETVAQMDEEAFTKEDGIVGQFVPKVDIIKPNMTLPKTKKENDTAAEEPVNMTIVEETWAPTVSPTLAPTPAPTAAPTVPVDASMDAVEDEAFKNEKDDVPPVQKQQVKKATKSFDNEEPDTDGWSKQNISAGTNGSNMTNTTHKPNATAGPTPKPTPSPTNFPTPKPTAPPPTAVPTEAEEEEEEKCDQECQDRLIMAAVNKDVAEEDKVAKESEAVVDNETAIAAEQEYNETATVLMEAVKKAAEVQKLLDDPDLTPSKKAELEAELANAKADAMKAEVAEVDQRAQIVKATKQVVETVNVVRMAESALDSANVTLDKVKEHVAKLQTGSGAGPPPVVPGAKPPTLQPTAPPPPATIAPTAPPTKPPPPTATPTATPTAAPTAPPTASDKDVSMAMALMGKLPPGYVKDYNCENKWTVEHCEVLGEHCATSMTMRMKCPKICGSCKEEFPLPEPKDPPPPPTSAPKPSEEQTFVIREARNLREANDDLRDTEKDVSNDDGSAEEYMKEASNVYDSYFVSAPVDRDSADAKGVVDLSMEDEDALFESINAHASSAESDRIRAL